jgi:hypothetical protein
VLFGLRKSWWIENDEVEVPSLLVQAAHPIKRIAINEIVLRVIEPVECKIATAPLEVFFRKIEAGHACTSHGRAD